MLESSIIKLTTVSSNRMGSKILIPFSWLHFGAEFLIVLIGHNSRLVIDRISWPVICNNRWSISDDQCNFDPQLFCCKINRRAQPRIHSRTRFGTVYGPRNSNHYRLPANLTLEMSKASRGDMATGSSLHYFAHIVKVRFVLTHSSTNSTKQAFLLTQKLLAKQMW